MAYADWRTRRAEENGLPWRFALTEWERWQFAGNGDGFYAFGDRFRPRWMSSCYARPVPSPEPVLSYPIDESVYGVFDMSGSALEWVDGWFWEEEPPTSTLGRLRVHGLVFVGDRSEKGRNHRTVVIPEDLRETISACLDGS